ncbi:hypothetical protein PYW07_011048 [Mythimna separata]|uniref:Uncharacterized protein n=1 Tax=Mythimna separata TaxID=271217 RepID=A0AAD7Y794_MYTSE|nr:hypothetical protein PYW07_011048 [Mythimna separata]
MELDFDKIFKIPTKALNISRAHPYIPRDWKWALQFCIVHGLFTLAFVNIIYNIICHDLKSNNFSQMCKNGVLFVVYIVITFQYCVLLWHQNALVDLIENMKRDYEQSKDLDSIEKEMFTKYAFNHGEVSLEFITFIVGGTLISSSPCYYSNLLMEKGENVRLSLYTCGWELHYDRRTRTTLQLMLQNALTPIAINTIFRALCLDALTDVSMRP